MKFDETRGIICKLNDGYVILDALKAAQLDNGNEHTAYKLQEVSNYICDAVNFLNKLANEETDEEIEQ